MLVSGYCQFLLVLLFVGSTLCAYSSLTKGDDASKGVQYEVKKPFRIKANQSSGWITEELTECLYKNSRTGASYTRPPVLLSVNLLDNKVPDLRINRNLTEVLVLRQTSDEPALGELVQKCQGRLQNNKEVAFMGRRRLDAPLIDLEPAPIADFVI